MGTGTDGEKGKLILGNVMMVGGVVGGVWGVMKNRSANSRIHDLQMQKVKDDDGLSVSLGKTSTVAYRVSW